MKERFRPTHYTNTSTGGAPNDPVRDPHETRRERQSVVKVTSRCTHKVPKEEYDEVRPQLRDGRDQERPSRSLGRPSASARHKEPAKSHQHRSKSPPTCRSLKVHQDNPFGDRAGEESSNRQRLDGAQRPTTASPALFKHLSTAARSAAEAMHVHAWEGVNAHGLAMRAELEPKRTPANRPRRRRWARSSCAIRSSTPRSRHLI